VGIKPQTLERARNFLTNPNNAVTTEQWGQGFEISEDKMVL
jgi:hypothetical protein